MSTDADVLGIFVRPMLALFRPASADPQNLELAIGRYVDNLAEFSPDALRLACAWFERNHASAWLPSIAECRQVAMATAWPGFEAMTLAAMRDHADTENRSIAKGAAYNAYWKSCAEGFANPTGIKR